MAEEFTNSENIANRPRLLTLDTEGSERHASWLELFFDLVFVLAVAKTAHILTSHTDPAGFLKFTVLFIPVWWSWVGYTFYADRFETNEAAYRVLTFMGMLAVIGLSLCLEESFTPQGDLPFIVCYILVRIVLIVLYIRSAYYVPLARTFSLQFIVGLGITCMLLLISVLFDPPVRYVIWGLALFAELATPYINIKLTRIFPIDHSHIPERLGLFTIIVLGEAVVSTANGASGVAWDLSTISSACLGFAMAVCIWWIVFDFVEDSGIRSKSLFARFVFLYGHFFIVASIIVIGIGVEHAIRESAGSRLHFPTLALLSGGVAVFLTAITVIRIIADVCRLVFIRLAGIVFSILLLFSGPFLPPFIVLAGFLIVLLGNVWLENYYAEIAEEGEPEPFLVACEHADDMQIFNPNSVEGCEECIVNNYKWVHLRLCLSCGHVGCCDSSVYKHATRHFREDKHPIIASLEPGENWAWCYEDERFVPLPRVVVNEINKVED
ncbi:MAG: low temperature requirement protein A [Acidobacteria bacterium]|nr:low temperature requirement protein A [Acidobacteriota bacterium]